MAVAIEAFERIALPPQLSDEAADALTQYNRTLFEEATRKLFFPDGKPILKAPFPYAGDILDKAICYGILGQPIDVDSSGASKSVTPDGFKVNVQDEIVDSLRHVINMSLEANPALDGHVVVVGVETGWNRYTEGFMRNRKLSFIPLLKNFGTAAGKTRLSPLSRDQYIRVYLPRTVWPQQTLTEGVIGSLFQCSTQLEKLRVG